MDSILPPEQEFMWGEVRGCAGCNQLGRTMAGRQGLACNQNWAYFLTQKSFSCWKDRPVKTPAVLAPCTAYTSCVTANPLHACTQHFAASLVMVSQVLLMSMVLVNFFFAILGATFMKLKHSWGFRHGTSVTTDFANVLLPDAAAALARWSRKLTCGRLHYRERHTAPLTNRQLARLVRERALAGCDVRRSERMSLKAITWVLPMVKVADRGSGASGASSQGVAAAGSAAAAAAATTCRVVPTEVYIDKLTLEQMLLACAASAGQAGRASSPLPAADAGKNRTAALAEVPSARSVDEEHTQQLQQGRSPVGCGSWMRRGAWWRGKGASSGGGGEGVGTRVRAFLGSSRSHRALPAEVVLDDAARATEAARSAASVVEPPARWPALAAGPTAARERPGATAAAPPEERRWSNEVVAAVAAKRLMSHYGHRVHVWPDADPRRSLSSAVVASDAGIGLQHPQGQSGHKGGSGNGKALCSGNAAGGLGSWGGSGSSRPGSSSGSAHVLGAHVKSVEQQSGSGSSAAKQAAALAVPTAMTRGRQQSEPQLGLLTQQQQLGRLYAAMRDMASAIEKSQVRCMWLWGEDPIYRAARRGCRVCGCRARRGAKIPMGSGWVGTAGAPEPKRSS